MAPHELAFYTVTENNDIYQSLLRYQIQYFYTISAVLLIKL